MHGAKAAILFGLIAGVGGAAVQLVSGDYWAKKEHWEPHEIALVSAPLIIALAVTAIGMHLAKEKVE